MKRRKVKIVFGTGSLLMLSASILFGQSYTSKDFRKTIITRDFISEGVTVADLNNDGQADIVAGYYWFEAPEWTRHEIAPSRIFDPYKEYSESFLNLALDVNLDGWTDVVIIDFPGKPGHWFENPKNIGDQWKQHPLADGMGISNESPGFIDIDGDGRTDILCGDVDKRQIVWLQAPVAAGNTSWTRHPLSEENVPGTEAFSHGIGYGDIDGDGINDVVIREGWFRGTNNKSSGDWKFMPADIGEPCSHMQVIDVNNDGRNDVVSASAHRLGVWWDEQTPGNQFKTHLITTLTAQTHASIMADLNGDGVEEYILGKRYLAHHGRDAGDADTPWLFYIQFTPGVEPYVKENIIDADSGAGLNIAVHDMNKDQKPDIIIANKNGVFLFENQMTGLTAAE